MSAETLSKIAVFKGKQIRRYWDEEKEKWFFSVVDVVEVLTDSSIPKRYWSDLKKKLEVEGSQVYEKIVQLKFIAADGKKYLSDAADTEIIFRIIQSIPSPKAEPFKLWLARVGYERVEETVDPELAIQRAMQTYLKKGYSPEWVNMRLKSIEIRKVLTDEWVKRGVKSNDEFADLTDTISLAWAGLTTKDYKKYKDLKKENLQRAEDISGKQKDRPAGWGRGRQSPKSNRIQNRQKRDQPRESFEEDWEAIII